MSNRVIIVSGQDGAIIERSLLDKERLYIGRDKKCEIVLEDSEVSRKHAAVIYKFGVVYIENISPTSQVLKGETAIEVSEWLEGEKVRIGPFSLSWQAQDTSSVRQNAVEEVPANDLFAIDEASPPPPDALSAEVVSAESANPNVPESFEIDPQNDSNDLYGGDNDAVVAGDQPVDSAPPAEPEAEPDYQAVSEASLDNSNGEKTSPSQSSSTGSVSLLGADAGTAVVTHSQFGVVLRVTKGEEIGREIKLSDGVSWTVGRSANADIQINNPKLSREHFKLIKIGRGFRIEDLGSANGTKVNGVAVSDAPLNSFDTIQAGPVEFQFLIADSKAANVALANPQPHMNLTDEQLLGAAVGDSFGKGPESQAKTAFAAPVLYTQQPQGAFNYAGQAQQPNFQSGFSSPGTSDFDHVSNTTAVELSGFKKLRFVIEQMPPKKKALYGVLALCLIAMAAMSLMPKPEAEAPAVAMNATPQIQMPSTPATNPDNAADASQISEDFYKLDPSKQKEIEELYVKADHALQAKDWKTAAEGANSILRLVKQYKNTKDILSEAQDRFNDNYVGSLNQSLNNVNEADAQNQEKAQILLENANKALSEERWDDAEEGFSAVLVLNPNSEEAAQGLAKAHNKDLNATVSMPGQAKAADPGQVAFQKEQDLMQAFSMQYEDAKNQMNNGLFGQAMDVLTGLDQKLRIKDGEYRDADRTPASIRDTFYNETKQMQLKVQDALDTAKAQLRSEYASQLADAEEFTNNKQYAQAREIYDKIVKFEPAFQDAVDARRKLYDKMIVEARNYYQEALIYESVGDLDLAIEGYQKTRDTLVSVDDYTATEYYKRSVKKLQRFGK